MRSPSAARTRRTDRVCAQGRCGPVRISGRDAWRPRTNSGRVTNLALVSQRSAATISRSTVRADRGMATHAMDLGYVLGAATSSAASLIDVSMVLPQWSPRDSAVAGSFNRRAAQLEGITRTGRRKQGVQLLLTGNSAHGSACSGSAVLMTRCITLMHSPADVCRAVCMEPLQTRVRVDALVGNHGFGHSRTRTHAGVTGGVLGTR